MIGSEYMFYDFHKLRDELTSVELFKKIVVNLKIFCKNQMEMNLHKSFRL